MSFQTLYESANARNLSPEQVAQTFVPNNAFLSLTRNEHALLMGPRGCGKTTILKMLTTRALHSWSDPIAEEIRRSLPFRAVYVPTDIHWHNQLQYSTGQLEKEPEFAALTSRVAVTTNVLYAIVSAMQDRVRYDLRGRFSDKAEGELCKILIQAWRLPPTIPSLSSLVVAINGRMNDLRIVTNKVLLSSKFASVIETLPDWYYLDYLSAAAIGCRAFDSILTQEDIRRWALCFDELELAPEWLQSRLVGEIRSTDEIFVFKLSTSPIPAFLDDTQARPTEDFRLVRMWSHKDDDAKRFCEELTGRLLSRAGFPDPSPRVVFGASPIAGESETRLEQDEYGSGSETYRIIRDEALADSTLRDLLVRHGISPGDPTTNDVRLRDQVLRKIKPTVYIRHALRKPGGSGSSVGRSRKIASIYHGADALYAISDGNPRWLIGIITELLASVSLYGKKSVKKIPAQTQSRILEQSSQKYSALLRSLPNATRDLGKSRIHVLGIVRAIGKYFNSRIVQGPFPLDPVGSFVVDATTPTEILDLLRLAIYHGAIVHIDPAAHAFDSDLKGKRFRLSFLLSPALRLPLRLYDSVPLSRCYRQYHDLELNPKSGSASGGSQGEHPSLPLEE